MNLIKISTILAREFLEFYDIKQYKKQAANQLVVKKYVLNKGQMVLNEEK